MEAALYEVQQIRYFPCLRREAEPSSETSLYIKESDDVRRTENKNKSLVNYRCVKTSYKSLFFYKNKF
jgi:hypothetical protein